MMEGVENSMSMCQGEGFPSCEDISEPVGAEGGGSGYYPNILELLVTSGPTSISASNNEGLLSKEREQLLSCVHLVVFEQLRNWGIPLEPPTTNTRGRSKARKPNSNKAVRIDGGANRLVEVKLKNCDVTVKVPVLIKESCDFLREHVTTEGIFRKSGSSSRVLNLMQRFQCLENPEGFQFLPSETVFDVATVLKQYLRGMEFPLIPASVHHFFRRSLEILSECSQEDAVLLCTCLLSESSIGILTYLVEFILEVVEHSDQNKMTCENLAIVIAPNIMPLDDRQSDKAKELEQERKFIEIHTKIVEILIRNGQKVGCLPLELRSRAESEFSSQQASEDELGTDGPGRRRKRRSGSLTRLLGFIRKVTSSKSGDTPVSQTPDFSDFTHTPIIKTGKRGCLEEKSIFSLQKKKTILDGIRKNGLCDTPNSMAGFITCPLPVCLNSSPKRKECNNTPNTSRFKNLVTPSLLRRKDKTANSAKIIAPMSAPAVPIKARFGLGKNKSSNKQVSKTPSSVLTENNCQSDDRGLSRSSRSLNLRHMTSTVSIRKLNSSPKKVIRASSTRIPRPDKCNPIRKSSSAYRFPVLSPRDISSMHAEHGKIAPSAQEIQDLITSNISCLKDTVDVPIVPTGQENEGQVGVLNQSLRLTPLIQEINTLSLTTEVELTRSGLRRKRSAAKMSDNSERECKSKSQPGSTTKTKPTPIPKRSSRTRSSGTSSAKPKFDSSPAEHTKTNRTPREAVRFDSIRSIEDRFRRAVKETKIMRVQSERSAQVKPRAEKLHRRFSMQAGGISPSQRRKGSNVTGKRSNELSQPQAQAASGESGGVAITTPLNDLARLGLQSAGPLSRSPNRCTLKRGRPNTLRAGLARPSPLSSRNTSVSGPAANKQIEGSSQHDNLSTPTNVEAPEQTRSGSIEHSERYMATPMKRMSSVQESVEIMDNAPAPTSIFQEVDPPSAPVERKNSFKPSATRTEPPLQKRTLSRRTSSATKFATPSPVSAKKSANQNIVGHDISTPMLPAKTRKTPSNSTEKWVPASNFSFETQSARLLNRVGVGAHRKGRESIQALSSMNAGKVLQNVRLFDGMSRTRKSPRKSLIPRYVALHQQESFNNSNNAAGAD